MLIKIKSFNRDTLANIISEYGKKGKEVKEIWFNDLDFIRMFAPLRRVDKDGIPDPPVKYCEEEDSIRFFIMRGIPSGTIKLVFRLKILSWLRAFVRK